LRDAENGDGERGLRRPIREFPDARDLPARWTVSVADGSGPLTTRAAGVSTLAAGLWLIGVGLWARRDVTHGLERERITTTSDATPPGTPVTDAAAARSMTEVIRDNTLASTGGKTYGETPPYVDAEGQPTADRELAARDALTGEPLENPEHALWIQSTALQTALMEAYLAQRLAELTVGLGAVFVGVGAGLAAAARR
jgi:hypothetical protein